MKKWNILSKFRVDNLVQILLENRGIKTKKEQEAFLTPKLETVTIKSVGIDKKQLQKALKRIEKAIKEKEQIVVFGDYDVDGIAGSAVLWETLYGLGAKVMPYIPHRTEEGYGLSIKGIENILPKPSLIITVDNGIVANDAVDFANKQGIDVIITDHHVPGKKLPKAHSIVHTTKLCGTGVAYLLAQEISNKSQILDHLSLVALATIADLVPLTAANRILTKYGLQALKKTKRVGLLELFDEAGIDKSTIGVYEVGRVIAPRLNAMGRLESAMDSLRLLCTKDKNRAKSLAAKLGTTNKERQVLTQVASLHALAEIRNQKSEIKKLLFIAHESYQQGVIGLVAGKLVEEFYRPSIVVAIGEKISKASARSVHGFNIIEFIRSALEYLVDAGGHPMAAGFTVETAKIPLLQKLLEKLAHTTLTEEQLIRTLRVDCELPLSIINQKLYKQLQVLAPFGMGNMEPTFVSRGVVIEDTRLIGKDKKHLKLKLVGFDAIAFGMGERAAELHVGDMIDIVYTINENAWNGNVTLQLKVKDISVA